MQCEVFNFVLILVVADPDRQNVERQFWISSRSAPIYMHRGGFGGAIAIIGDERNHRIAAWDGQMHVSRSCAADVHYAAVIHDGFHAIYPSLDSKRVIGQWHPDRISELQV